MKKTHNSEKVLGFFAKNVGFVGLLTVINFLLIYFLFSKLQQSEMRIKNLEAATNSVVNDMNNLSQPIIEEETEPATN